MNDLNGDHDGFYDPTDCFLVGSLVDILHVGNRVDYLDRNWDDDPMGYFDSNHGDDKNRNRNSDDNFCPNCGSIESNEFVDGAWLVIDDMPTYLVNLMLTSMLILKVISLRILIFHVILRLILLMTSIGILWGRPMVILQAILRLI